MDDGRYPKLIVFDLDYTLWNFFIDSHIEPPLKQDLVTGIVYDSAYDPNRVEFFEDVPEILRRLKSRKDVTVAVASRSFAPKLAREALQLIKIPTSSSTTGRDITNVTDNDRVESLPAISFLDHLEIYPGSKIAHFKRFHKLTGIPYGEMLFFDDEMRNKEVERDLGVTFVLVSDGVNWECFRSGLLEWRKRHATEDESASC